MYTVYHFYSDRVVRSFFRIFFINKQNIATTSENIYQIRNVSKWNLQMQSYALQSQAKSCQRFIQIVFTIWSWYVTYIDN